MLRDRQSRSLLSGSYATDGYAKKPNTLCLVFCFVFGIALVVIAHVLYPEETKRFLKNIECLEITFFQW